MEGGNESDFHDRVGLAHRRNLSRAQLRLPDSRFLRCPYTDLNIIHESLGSCLSFFFRILNLLDNFHERSRCNRPRALDTLVLSVRTRSFLLLEMGNPNCQKLGRRTSHICPKRDRERHDSSNREPLAGNHPQGPKSRLPVTFLRKPLPLASRADSGSGDIFLLVRERRLGKRFGNPRWNVDSDAHNCAHIVLD